MHDIQHDSAQHSGHSTITTLLQMCDNWYENMDNGKLTGVVFIDIRKAFDSVDHSILLKKLAHYGVSHKLNLHGFNPTLRTGRNSVK